MKDINIMTEIHKELTSKVNKSIEKLMLDMLVGYGINNDNWREHIDRILVCEHQGIKHFFVDNEYAFTISCELISSDNYESIENYKIEFVHKAYVDEKMKKMYER